MSFSLMAGAAPDDRPCFTCLRPEQECICPPVDSEYEAYLVWFRSAVDRGEITGGLEYEDMELVR